MRHTFAVTVAVALAATSVASAQEGPVLLSADASLTEYGLPSLDSVRLARVALVHALEGDRIALQLLRRGPAAPAPAPSPDEASSLPPGNDQRTEARAMWVWSTAEILSDALARARFLEFVKERSIGRVFLYVPAAEGRSPFAGFLPFDGEALAPLLAALHERGAKTYALDGDPDYVRPENHPGVLRTVRRVIEHNRTHPPEERFHGVRYDVEPYVLPAFQGPDREKILTDWVGLLESVSTLAHEADLRVGADIPFWLDAGDEMSGEPFEAVVDGERRPALELIMRTVDDVAVMAYRTHSEGADGVVPNASGEVALGRGGDAGVYVGIETTRIDDEELYTVRGPGRTGVPPLADARWVVAEELDGGTVRVWLAEGPRALDALTREAEDPRALRYWFAGQPAPVPGDMISFHSLGADAMWSVAAEIDRRFGSQPGYLGLAFHDYRGLSELLGR